MSSSNNKESLLEACSKGNIARFREIIQKWDSTNRDSSIDVKDNHNFGALHHAVRSCNLEMVQAVLDYKDVFDMTVRSFEGWSCLFLCCCYPKRVPVEIFTAILEASENVSELMAIRNNEEVSVLHKAVEMGKQDYIKELFRFNCDPNPLDLDRESPLHYAVRNGDIDMIKLLIETGKSNAKISNYTDFEPLCLVIGMDYEDTKKLEIIQYLLPYTYSEDPTKSGYFSVFEILKPLVLSCRKTNTIISQFLINSFYIEQFNSKYWLIRKLEKASNHSHIVCAFFHDEICRYDQYYCLLFKHMNIEANIIRVILELIMSENSDSMCLAVETSRALLNIHFDSFLKEEFLYQHPPEFEMFLSNFEQIPHPKLLFHFVYQLLDPETEPKLFDLIFCCFTVCNPNDTPQIFRMTFQILIPFVIKDYHYAALLQECNNHDALDEIQTFIPYAFVSKMIPLYSQTGDHLCQLKSFTLKRLCRDTIRMKVAENVTSPKEFINRIVDLTLPETLKCYLLHICDTSWIKGLKIN
uniref:CSON006984 protein n=1 Tax=Culicoides sonorensis TaxID=179676 RepID=A0A336MU96_CULSO